MVNRSDVPIQTLHLNDRDKAKLLWAIEQANRKDENAPQRALRISCTNNEAMITLKSDGGSEAKLAVLARNLSQWGIALVHGRYVHPNSRCVVTIPAKTGMMYDALGTVRHIRHIQGTIHELGVQFDEPIDLSEFVDMSQAEETQYMRELADEMPNSEGEDVDQLINRVLVVDDFSCDRKLFSHWLTQAGLEVTASADSRSAHVQVQEQVFDLLIVDLCLGTEKGIDLISEMRRNNVVAPIIAVSADEDPQILADVLSAGANDFLKKPFTKSGLTKKVNALLGVNGADMLTPIYSTQQADTEMRPLLTEFARKLKSYIEDLREASAQTNHDAIGELTRKLKGAGEGYGFPDITRTATDLISEMEKWEPEVEEIRHATNELIAVLNRVKVH